MSVRPTWNVSSSFSGSYFADFSFFISFGGVNTSSQSGHVTVLPTSAPFAYFTSVLHAGQVALGMAAVVVSGQQAVGSGQ